MPHFLVLALFGILLLVEAAALCLCAALPALRRWLPYGWRVLVGSGLGFLVANVGAILLGIVPVLLASALGVDKDGTGGHVVGLFALLGLFLGPLIASPLGFLAGAWIGLRRALRAQSLVAGRGLDATTR